MSVVQTIRNAIFGNPATPGFKPSREGVVRAFEELQETVRLNNLGLQAFATLAELNAFIPDEPGMQARVYDDTTATNNVVWIYRDGIWQKDLDYINSLLTIVAPYINLTERALLVPDGETAPGVDLTGIADGDLLQYVAGQIVKVDLTPFNGKYLTGGPSGLVPVTGTGGDTDLRIDLGDNSAGSLLINFIEASVDAVSTSVRTVLRMFPVLANISFGIAGTGLVDDRAKIIKAIDYCVATGRKGLFWGTPLVSAPIEITDGYFAMIGRGGNFESRRPVNYFLKGSTCNGPCFLVSGQHVEFEKLNVVGIAGNLGPGVQWTGHSGRLVMPYFGGTFEQECLRVGEFGVAAPNSNAMYIENPCIDAVAPIGIRFDDGENPGDYTNANSALIVKPEIRHVGIGFFIGNSFGGTILTPLVESCAFAGVYFSRRAFGWSIYGGDVEQNTAGSSATGSDLYLQDTEYACTMADTGDVVTCNSHGFENGHAIIFSYVENAAGITEGQAYYIRNKTVNTFQIETLSHVPVVFTSDGIGIFHQIVAGGDRGQNSIIGTNIGTPAYDNQWQTTRMWRGANGFGALSRSGVSNGETAWSPRLRCVDNLGVTTGEFTGTFKGRCAKNGGWVQETMRFDVSGFTGTPTGAILIGPFRHKILVGEPVIFGIGRASYVTLPANRYMIQGERYDAHWIKLTAGAVVGNEFSTAILGQSQSNEFKSNGVVEIGAGYWSAD